MEMLHVPSNLDGCEPGVNILPKRDVWMEMNLSVVCTIERYALGLHESIE